MVVEIVNSRPGVAYCTCNHQKMNQGRCTKANFQMLIVHKSLLKLDDELDLIEIYTTIKN